MLSHRLPTTHRNKLNNKMRKNFNLTFVRFFFRYRVLSVCLKFIHLVCFCCFFFKPANNDPPIILFYPDIVKEFTNINMFGNAKNKTSFSRNWREKYTFALPTAINVQCQPATNTEFKFFPNYFACLMFCSLRKTKFQCSNLSHGKYIVVFVCF